MKSMHFAQTFLLAGLILPGMQDAEQTAAPQSASLELYGTFQAMGVIVSLSAGDDPEQNAVAGLAYRPSGQGAFGQGFPLSRIGATRFVGSLFWLQAGTSYDVRVTFSDPGGILDGVSVQSAGTTRSEVSLPTPSQAYYVSNHGSGSLCSLAQPCGLTEGLNRVGPGQAVILRGGVYYQGEINRNTSNSGYGASGPIFLFHNTGDAALADNDGFEVKSPGSWARLYLRNNIWAGTAYALSNANPNQPLDMDYDDLYTTLPGELAYWEGLPDRHLRTLPMLQAASGQELHGINQPPGFRNAAGGDYHLSPTSGLVDVGLIIPGINADYLGSGPDLGAFEQQNLPIRCYLPLILK